MKFALKATTLLQHSQFYVDWCTTFNVLFTCERLVASNAMFGQQTIMIRQLLQEERHAEINPYFLTSNKHAKSNGCSLQHRPNRWKRPELRYDLLYSVSTPYKAIYFNPYTAYYAT